MSDWALSACERQEFSTAVADRGAANTKGAYVQLIASTGFQYSAISITLGSEGGGGQCYLVDIAVGASGSEQVIVPNMLFDSSRAIGHSAINITLPISIPAGSRIAARIQEAGGSGTRQVRVGLIGRAGGANYSQAVCNSAVNYGSNTSTSNGILVDPGATANTYGLWTEITSATTAGHAGLSVVLGTNQQTGTLVDSGYSFQLGIGASGSEVTIAEWLSSITSNANRMQINSFDIRATVPSGTRLAMRSKCFGSGAAGARHTSAIILGY